jgi:hypothetical protein
MAKLPSPNWNDLVVYTLKYELFGHRIYKSSSSGRRINDYDRDFASEETNSAGTMVPRYQRSLSCAVLLAL